MAIKMRVLHASKKKKILDMAKMIHAKYELAINAVDTIPPAYSCNNERLVVLMLSLKGDPEDQVRLFCRELTKARAQNVALVIDGNEAAADKMKAILKEAGTNVADEVHYVKCAFLPFLDKITPEEQEALLAFVQRTIDNLQ